jgi:hypothetical protein
MSQPNLTAVISPSSLKAGTGTPAVTDDLTLTIFEQDIPAFAEAELDRLYHGTYASLAHWRAYGGAGQASTFIARNNDIDDYLARFAYRLGTVSCYLTICDCIRRGGKEFHFLWGRYAYKTMLEGEHRGLSRVLVYRSRSALVRHAAIAARSAVNAASHRAKYWILEPERQNHPVVRAAVNALKKIRRMGDHPA